MIWLSQRSRGGIKRERPTAGRSAGTGSDRQRTRRRDALGKRTGGWTGSWERQGRQGRQRRSPSGPSSRSGPSTTPNAGRSAIRARRPSAFHTHGRRVMPQHHLPTCCKMHPTSEANDSHGRGQIGRGCASFRSSMLDTAHSICRQQSARAHSPSASTQCHCHFSRLRRPSTSDLFEWQQAAANSQGKMVSSEDQGVRKC